jgi:hypothetical protein
MFRKDTTPPPDDEGPTFEMGKKLSELPTKAQYRALLRYRSLLMRTAAAERNANDPHPAREYPGCHSLFKSGDGGWLFKSVCSTCDVNRLEAIVWAIVVKHGRKETKRLLEDLGSK